MPALPVHHTPVDTESSFDGPEMEAKIPNDVGASTLRKAYAWVDPEANPDTKSAYKFIHHMVDVDGNIGDANYRACVAGIAVLNGARGGTTISDSDRQGVYDHLAAHIRDAGKEPPELKSRSQLIGEDREVRMFTSPVELRASQDGVEYIEGYALKFNRWSDIMGWLFPFREIISPSALDGADMSNVVALVNHDPNLPLARNTVTSGPGSLQLSVDNIGLRFKLIPTDTSYVRDLMANMRAGVVSQCSFAFTVADGGDEVQFNEDLGIYERTINQLGRIYDVSVVTTPAYPDTEAVVGQRSLEKMMELEDLRHRRVDTREIEKLRLELDLLDLLDLQN